MPRVWIAEGCLPCSACEASCPEVFAVPDDEAVVVAAARSDGIGDHNRERQAELTTAASALWSSIEEAAQGCPVEVIILEP